MRPAVVMCSLALGLASGGLAACGGSGSTAGLIPTSDASSLEASIQRVQNAVDNGDCSLAGQRVDAVNQGIEGLPSSVDPELVDRLRSGVTRLQEQASTDCQGTRTTTPSIVTEPTVPTTTETEVPTVETEPEVPTTTEAPPATTTEETPAPAPTTETPAPAPTTETPAPEPTDPPDDGGDGGDGGTGGIAPAF